MTKEELHQFAAAGVAQKIGTIEKELATYHKEWPELFLSATPPQLLKAAVKANGNGHWPPVVAEAPAPQKKNPSGTWTPKRRALMARYMKKRSKELHAAKMAKHAAEQTPKRTLSAATRRKLALAMQRRHASGEIARARANAKASA